jgi:hypothetical protein
MNANTPKRCNLPSSSEAKAEHYALIATASDAIGRPADFPASAARSVLQGFPTRLVMLIGALGVALLAESQQSAISYGVLATALALGLVPTRRNWIGRRSGKLAILLAIGAILGTLAVGGDLIRILVAASPMAVVIVLILCVALIRPALAELGLEHAVAAIAARTPRSLRGCAILLGVTIAGLGLSFGAVSIFGGSLRGRTDDDATAARAAMRGLALSMTLGPSTASVAAVMAAYPHVGWGDALLIGLPIALVGIVIGSIAARRLTISAEPASARELTRAILAILAVPAVAVLLRLAFGLSMTLAIATAAVIVAVVLLTCATRAATRKKRGDMRQVLLRSDVQLGEAWAQASAETALFLACGLVLGFMREPVIAESARAVLAFVPRGYPDLLVMMVGVPLVTTLGIHPMALFAILAPVLTPSVLGMSEPSVFQAWIVAVGLSMIVSPASILTVTTVLSFGVPADRLCLRGNGLYAAGLAAIATCLFLILS